jgi:hypothetical protein
MMVPDCTLDCIPEFPSPCLTYSLEAPIGRLARNSGGAMATTIELIYGTAFVTLYFTPSIVAFCRAKSSRFGIAFLNLLAGWTVIGWIAAFIWACV